MRKTTAVMFLMLMLVSQAHGYGQKGHTTVGAIADSLIKGKPVAAKVTALLDGLTLAEASIIPDKIKDWDKGGPSSTEVFHLPAHPKIEAALLAFWEANPPKKNDPKTRPSHHWFHYTDVPIEGDEKYADGKIGRQQWDIVHMISYCIKVLDGSEPEDNARKITKPIAVILLAHYLGDIHQPLHVGAEFFDAEGKPTHPTDESKAAEDQGGNTIFLLDVPGTEGRRGDPGPKLHGFWDDDVVDAAYKQISDDINPDAKRNVATTKVIEYLVAHEPKGWKPAAKSKPIDWAEAWANEILPIAKEAHARLVFSDITVEKSRGGLVARGNAKPREMTDKISYKDWSGKIVRAELHKGGWRLAELLERVVK